jgi:hypothetical protein
LLKKHGIEPFHYFKEAIATVSQQGRDIMDRVLAAIESKPFKKTMDVQDLIFTNFRERKPKMRSDPDKCSTNPLSLSTHKGSSKKWSLKGKRVLLVPACPLTQKLLSDPEIQQAAWIGFVDRNPIQHGKTIEGRSIYSYEAIASMRVDAILIAPPEKHRLDILNAVARNTPIETQIAELI